jgi:hypothetical protein
LRVFEHCGEAQDMKDSEKDQTCDDEDAVKVATEFASHLASARFVERPKKV